MKKNRVLMCFAFLPTILLSSCGGSTNDVRSLRKKGNGKSPFSVGISYKKITVEEAKEYVTDGYYSTEGISFSRYTQRAQYDESIGEYGYSKDEMHYDHEKLATYSKSHFELPISLENESVAVLEADAEAYSHFEDGVMYVYRSVVASDESVKQFGFAKNEFTRCFKYELNKHSYENMPGLGAVSWSLDGESEGFSYLVNKSSKELIINFEEKRNASVEGYGDYSSETYYQGTINDKRTTKLKYAKYSGLNTKNPELREATLREYSYSCDIDIAKKTDVVYDEFDGVSMLVYGNLESLLFDPQCHLSWWSEALKYFS